MIRQVGHSAQSRRRRALAAGPFGLRSPDTAPDCPLTAVAPPPGIVTRNGRPEALRTALRGHVSRGSGDPPGDLRAIYPLGARRRSHLPGERSRSLVSPAGDGTGSRRATTRRGSGPSSRSGSHPVGPSAVRLARSRWRVLGRGHPRSVAHPRAPACSVDVARARSRWRVLGQPRTRSVALARAGSRTLRLGVDSTDLVRQGTRVHPGRIADERAGIAEHRARWTGCRTERDRAAGRGERSFDRSADGLGSTIANVP